MTVEANVGDGLPTDTVDRRALLEAKAHQAGFDSPAMLDELIRLVAGVDQVDELSQIQLAHVVSALRHIARGLLDMATGPDSKGVGWWIPRDQRPGELVCFPDGTTLIRPLPHRLRVRVIETTVHEVDIDLTARAWSWLQPLNGPLLARELREQANHTDTPLDDLITPDSRLSGWRDVEVIHDPRPAS